MFEGFEQSNTTPIPDILFDELLSELSGAELKVLLYIMRRTWGFKKDADAISLSQFERGITTRDGRVLDRGCGLNRETITKSLHSLESKGCIVSEKQMAGTRERAVTIYKIRFKGESEVVGKSDQEGSRKSELPLVGKSAYPGRKIRQGVVGKSDPQETVIQQTDLQETERQERKIVHSFTFSDEENQFLDWVKAQGYTPKLSDEKRYLLVKDYLAQMLPYVTTFELCTSLRAYSLELINARGLADKTVYLGNMAADLQGWLNSQKTAEVTPQNEANKTMNKVQANQFRLSLLSTFPSALVDIHQPFSGEDLWSVRIQYAPGEWLPFACPEHYETATGWERDRIEEARVYAVSLKERVS